MVDQTPRYRRVAPYKFEQSVRTEDPVTAFLSDYDDQPDPSEYVTPPAQGRQTFRLDTNSCGCLGDCSRGNSVRAVFFGCHTRYYRQRQSFNCRRLPAPYAAVQSDPSQLTARDTQEESQ